MKTVFTLGYLGVHIYKPNTPSRRRIAITAGTCKWTVTRVSHLSEEGPTRIPVALSLTRLLASNTSQLEASLIYEYRCKGRMFAHQLMFLLSWSILMFCISDLLRGVLCDCSLMIMYYQFRKWYYLSTFLTFYVLREISKLKCKWMILFTMTVLIRWNQQPTQQLRGWLVT